MPDFVTLNVLNYNTYEKTKRCIESCLRQKYENKKVILIDNDSSDDSFLLLKKEFGDQILYLRNEANCGYALGNNLGVKYSASLGADFAFILNSDTRLVSDKLLAKMMKIITKQKNCAILAPEIYNITSVGKVLNKNKSSYLTMLINTGIIKQNKNDTISEELDYIYEAQGSALLCRINSFVEVGGFSTEYYMYNEEATLCKKMIWQGYNIFWFHDSNSYVEHYHDKSGKIEEWRLFLMGRNLTIEYYKYRKMHFIPWLTCFEIYLIYQRIKHFRDKDFSYYFLGIKEGRKLMKNSFSEDMIYNNAIKRKEEIILQTQKLSDKKY